MLGVIGHGIVIALLQEAPTTGTQDQQRHTRKITLTCGPQWLCIIWLATNYRKEMLPVYNDSIATHVVDRTRQDVTHHIRKRHITHIMHGSNDHRQARSDVDDGL